MGLDIVERTASWPLLLPYYDGKVPAGFPSPAEDYLETELDLTGYLIENRAATFVMRVDGDSMRDAGILDGDLPGGGPRREAGQRLCCRGCRQLRVHGQEAAPWDGLRVAGTGESEIPAPLRVDR